MPVELGLSQSGFVGLIVIFTPFYDQAKEMLLSHQASWKVFFVLNKLAVDSPLIQPCLLRLDTYRDDIIL